MPTTTTRIFNFAAGPAVLPLPVLEEAQRDLVSLPGVGRSILEVSHRSKVFEDVLQIPPEMVKARFGYMREAFKYGAPPHGGIALGFDRLNAILCGTTSIRDVIAFPKTAKGTDLMTEAPGIIEPKQLRDLYLELKVAKKE